MRAVCRTELIWMRGAIILQTRIPEKLLANCCQPFHGLLADCRCEIAKAERELSLHAILSIHVSAAEETVAFCVIINISTL
jgi:hypothetical protein